MSDNVLHGDFISDGGVLWRAEDTRLYGYIADIPNYYERESLFRVTGERTRIETPSRLLVNINNHGYIAEQSYTLNLNVTSYYDADSTHMATAANRAGKDIYIYAVEVQNSEVPGFVLSLNSTIPAGYTTANSRKIGGFHCLCASTGAIAGHPFSGYSRGNIIPTSIWDIKHRPVASPEGMAWVEPINKWVDIYLNNWNGVELVSKFGADIACGINRNSQMWNGEKFAEYLAKVNKMLPSRADFMVFAKESNERTNIYGSSDPVTTGAHVDTNTLRMISNYGLEDCCGALYQWTSDIYESTPGTTYTNGEQFMDGYYWNSASVFKSGADTIEFGSSYGTLRRLAVGGAYNTTIYAGSRCVKADMLSAYPSMLVGARGVSLPKAS